MEPIQIRLRQIVGDDCVLLPDALPPPPWDTGQPFRGACVVTPDSVDRLAAVLAACHERAQAVVPMGGMTGLVQGSATQGGEIGLSLARLNRIESVDPVAMTLTAQAGVTLGEAQKAARARDLYFPVDIGARDTCQLGGNAATNAGGTRVIRYGMMRSNILGLEAVLADGTIVSSMNAYLKNNSGYDLKQLFVGSEGTLGIITRLVLRLDAAPRSHEVGLLAASDFGSVVRALQLLRSTLGPLLCGFEVMWRSFYTRATRPSGSHPSPLGEDFPYYVLVESTGSDAVADPGRFEQALLALLDSGIAADGVIAKSDRERDAIWAIRHDVEWLVRDAINFDVSLRIVDAGAYVQQLVAALAARVPGAECAAFGHLGDNNLHLSVLARDESAVQACVYDTLAPFSGAVSAEHGIGLEKKPYLALSRSPQEIALMQTLKRALDPRGILNPGKIIDA